MNNYNYANEIIKDYDQSNSHENYKRFFTSGYEIEDENVIAKKVENYNGAVNINVLVETARNDYTARNRKI